MHAGDVDPTLLSPEGLFPVCVAGGDEVRKGEGLCC